LQEMDVNDDGVLDLREFVTWITYEGDNASHIPQRSHESQATPERQAGRAKHANESKRVRMTCPVCGYKSYPQWLNDEAHCLKCDHVVKTRPSCHDKDAALYKKTHNVQSASAEDAKAAAARLSSTPVTATNGGGGEVHLANDDPAPNALARATYGAATAKKRNERVKMECPQCGYHSIPQWMNDQAHCLKCDMVIKKQKDIFGHMPNF